MLHGAGLGAWIWERVLPHLTTPADALDLPGRGDGSNPGEVTLAQCIAFAAKHSGPKTIVVGHSISAEVAVAVAEKNAGVILVGGTVPESGKSFMSLMPLPLRLFMHVLLRRAKNGIELPPGLVKKGYCNDLDEATTELVLRKVTPEAPRLYLDRLDWSLPKSMPRAYVKLTSDTSVKPKEQDRMIARIGPAKVETMDTGHLPMLARPEEMAAVLERLAQAF